MAVEDQDTARPLPEYKRQPEVATDELQAVMVKDMSGGVTSLTVKVKTLVLLPGEAVTIMVEAAIGVVLDVEIVTIIEQPGLQDELENEAVAPAGKPLAEKETTWVAPLVKPALMVALAELPCPAEILPELAKE